MQFVTGQTHNIVTPISTQQEPQMCGPETTDPISTPRATSAAADATTPPNCINLITPPKATSAATAGNPVHSVQTAVPIPTAVSTGGALADYPLVHSPPPRQTYIPAQLSGSDSDDPHRPSTPSHSLPVFFSLGQLQSSPAQIKSLQSLVQYLWQTRDEVCDDFAGLTSAKESHHHRRVEARAEIMCELRNLKTDLDCVLRNLP